MTPQSPVVSVLMTAFNRELYIGAAIESVLAQTFEDFELLIVDDRSSDATVAIARAYAARDPRVRIVVNDRNLGDYPNRNRAASLARGRYLKYHDSDDIMYPHCLATMVPALEAEPRAAFAISTSQAWAGGPCPMLLAPRLSYQREFLGYGMFMCGPASALFRRDVFSRDGGFPEEGPHSDYLFWLRFCRTEWALLLPADLFWYRIHPGQHLRGRDAGWDSAALGQFTWRSLNDAACPLTADERELAKRNYTFIVAKCICRDVRRGAIRLALYRLRQSGLTRADWARYLRFPRRSAEAGVPPVADADRKIRAWLPRAEPSLRP